MAEEKRYEYWDIKNPPLLLQGFRHQAVNAGVINEDPDTFTLEVNRGVVVAIDYSSINLAIIAAGFDETLWNDAVINCNAGGQDMLQNVPAERFDYNVDLGNQKEQKVWTWLNGGQTIISNLSISSTSNAPVPNIRTQLHCYYSTEGLEQWRKTFTWKNGLGLKRRSYVVSQPNTPATLTIENVLPKNQGMPIGFSILYLATNAFEALVTLYIDGIAVIKDVSGERFSRFWQRDPLTFLLKMNPGSKFELSVVQPNTTSNIGRVFLEFYFDN